MVRKEIPKGATLTDSCYALLRGMIIRCELEPGLKFQEREMIERSGFGRTPVHEALARLGLEGLVLILPRSGYQVSPLTVKTVEDLFEVWRHIGPLIMRLAFRRMTLEERVQLLNVARATNHLPPQADDLVELTRLFEFLAQLTCNDHLVAIQHRLFGEMDRIFTIFRKTEAGIRWGEAQARELLEMVDIGDSDVAAAATIKSIAVAYVGALEAVRVRVESLSAPS